MKSSSQIKKIFVVGPAYPYRGGPARFNESLCKALCEKNIETQIISFTLQYPSLLFPGTSQYETSDVTPHFPFKIIRMINTISPVSWWKTARYINQHQPDAVIFRYWLPFFAPAFGTISRLLHSSIKIIALTDNIIPHEKRIGDKFLTRYFLSKCDGFIVMSDKVMNDLNEFVHTENKILIPHPLYENYPPALSKIEARKKLNLPVNEKILLFFGLIRSYKGLDILLQAIANENLKSKNFYVLIAGEFYDDKDKYLQLIQQLNIQDKIILHDKYIPDEEVGLYFSAADVVVQPYKSATNSGVSMVSYFYDKPIISTNVGGLKEIVINEKTGWLCEPNAQSVSHAIQKFLNTTNIETFENNIRLFKQQFSWENFADKTIQLIEKIDNSR